jgi:multidrug efflux pump subunit AcrA (membrane-fusion protein)
MKTQSVSKRAWNWNAASTLVGLLLTSALWGCAGSEKEKEPVVTVQATAARRSSLSEVVTAEAVIYPLKQATVAPKITSTITDFKVQRGSRVKKGQLLAVLENKDLTAQAKASLGDFENWTLLRRRLVSMPRRKCTKVVRTYTSRVRSRGEISIRRKSR